jgi:hypothetical protein
MKKTWINIAALICGIALGPSALNSAKMARPPIDWLAILFILIGCLIGIIFVMGIQIYKKNSKYGRIALIVFTPLSILLFGAGLGALMTGILRSEYNPTSFFFLAIGSGLALGVFLSRVVYRVRFKELL